MQWTREDPIESKEHMSKGRGRKAVSLRHKEKKEADSWYPSITQEACDIG